MRALTALLLLATAGCATGGSRLEPTTPPQVQLTGPHSAVWAGPQTWVAVDWQYAGANLAEEWLVLDVAITGAENRAATVERDEVFVRTPSGRRVSLASQRDLSQAWTDLRGGVRRAVMVADPISPFPGSRRGCRFNFFAVPGTRVTTDRVSVNDRRACRSLLFFQVPGGVEAGRWVFGIRLEESEVRIPFDLGG